MKKEQVVNCQFSVWYPIFKKHTIKRYTPRHDRHPSEAAVAMTLSWGDAVVMEMMLVWGRRREGEAELFSISDVNDTGAAKPNEFG